MVYNPLLHRFCWNFTSCFGYSELRKGPSSHYFLQRDSSYRLPRSVVEDRSEGCLKVALRRMIVQLRCAASAKAKSPFHTPTTFLPKQPSSEKPNTILNPQDTSCACALTTWTCYYFPIERSCHRRKTCAMPRANASPPWRCLSRYSAHR